MNDYITIAYCQTEIGDKTEYILAKAPMYEYIQKGYEVTVDFCGKRRAKVLQTANFRIGEEKYNLLLECEGVTDFPKIVEKIVTLNIKWEDEDARTNQGI